MRPSAYTGTYVMIEKINLAGKLASFDECWRPKIIGEVNDCYIKLAKLKGDFVWHCHEEEDELFLVVKGQLRMRFRDGELEVNEGELVIVPKGVAHLPVADEETHVVLVEPKTTVNTGNVTSARTIADPERI